MKVTTSKSKNSESFYIAKSFINSKGVSTSINIRKLGTLAELLIEHGPTREDVMTWAREEAKAETKKYKEEQKNKAVQITFHADREIAYDKQVFYRGGYLFLQSMYYRLGLNKTCRKLRDKYRFKFDLNAILSDLIFTRILEPASKRSSYAAASKFLEKPSYQLHDIYRALEILGKECDFIQSEAYKNSLLLGPRNDKILFYDCTNYYFEIEQEDGAKKYGKSKEHRPNPIIQMGLFMDGDGIPLAFSLFPGNANEQTSLKPLEEKVLSEFGCQKFIYCSDAGLGSEKIRTFNHMGERAFIVTQSIKKLNIKDREWALNTSGFRCLCDDRLVDLSEISEDDSNLYYKEAPYTPQQLQQRLIITYSPKYARYQKMIRAKQVERAKMMLEHGTYKRERRNPNDPARFISKIVATSAGEKAEVHPYFDEGKVENEALYDGLYAVATDLLDDTVSDILKISEKRWEIEECFRIMKTDFEARPVFLQKEKSIQAHFLTCFLALMLYRYLEKELKNEYTCEAILTTLKEINFADVQEQGFIPLYKRSKLTDALHEACGFRTDFEFISKQQMKTIQKKSKGRE